MDEQKQHVSQETKSDDWSLRNFLDSHPSQHEIPSKKPQWNAWPSISCWGNLVRPRWLMIQGLFEGTAGLIANAAISWWFSKHIIKIRWDHSDGTKLLPLHPLFSCSQTSLSNTTSPEQSWTTRSTLQSSNVTGREIPELAMEVSFAAQIPYPIESPQVVQRTHVILLMAQDMPAREANLSP